MKSTALVHAAPPVSRDRIISHLPKVGTRSFLWLEFPVPFPPRGQGKAALLAQVGLSPLSLCPQWYTPEAALQLKDHFPDPVRRVCQQRNSGAVG